MKFRMSKRILIIVVALYAFVSICYQSVFGSTSTSQLFSLLKPRVGEDSSPEHRKNEPTTITTDQLSQLDKVEVEVEVNPRPKLAKVTMLYGDENTVYERALQSHKDHAELHNYEIKILRQKMLGRLWTKPAFLLSIVLHELTKPPPERLQWIFWFDADTVIVNPSIPLEIYLPPQPALSHISFLCGNDHNGLNDGGFLLRVNDYAVHMLSAALSVETFRPEVDLKYSEQSAIEHVVLKEGTYRPWDGTTYLDGYAEIPQRWLNAYMGARNDEGVMNSRKKFSANTVKEGDLLLHFVGSGDTKRDRMSRFMDSWQRNSTTWNRPVEETDLRSEISEFWKKFSIKDAQRYREKEEAKQKGMSATIEGKN